MLLLFFTIMGFMVFCCICYADDRYSQWRSLIDLPSYEHRGALRGKFRGGFTGVPNALNLELCFSQFF